MTDTLPTEPTAPPSTDVSELHTLLSAVEDKAAEIGVDTPDMVERIKAFAARVHDEFDAMATKIDRMVNP